MKYFYFTSTALVTLLSGVTQTVSVGEAVTFRIETEEAGFVWKKGGNDSPSLWQNQHVVSIPSVQITDADIYECHGVGDRGRGQHTIMRLLVRGKHTGMGWDHIILPTIHVQRPVLCIQLP